MCGSPLEAAQHHFIALCAVLVQEDTVQACQFASTLRSSEQNGKTLASRAVDQAIMVTLAVAEDGDPTGCEILLR